VKVNKSLCKHLQRKNYESSLKNLRKVVDSIERIPVLFFYCSVVLKYKFKDILSKVWSLYTGLLYLLSVCL